jgi:hypothetical protein
MTGECHFAIKLLEQACERECSMIRRSAPMECRWLDAMSADFVMHHVTAICAPPGREPKSRDSRVSPCRLTTSKKKPGLVSQARPRSESDQSCLAEPLSELPAKD